MERKYDQSQFFTYTFTQADVDAVLYGYLRTQPDSDMPLHSISGLKFIPYQYPQGMPGMLTPLSPMPSALSSWTGPSTATATGKSKSNSQRFFPGSPNKPMELPSYLKIRHMQIGNLFHVGIFSTGAVLQGTRLGPFTGRIVKPEEMDGARNNSCIWEVFSNGKLSHYIDGAVDHQNWMKAINCARYKKEQNLIVFQDKGEVFYETIRRIAPGEELLVWYGNAYDLYMDIPITYKIVAKQEKIISVEQTAPEDTGSFPCEYCGKVFSYKYYRDKHLKYTRCVDQGDRKFPCHLCSRSFEKRDRLRIHVLHVHQKHRPHLCGECGKRFSQSSSLSKHQRVHSGDRPYKCPHCVKAFTASSILRTHMRQHSGERPFKCKHCGKAFASHAAHDSHVRRTHTKVKPCVCTVCEKAFAQSYELKFHMNIHTGAKPYECEKCGRGFSSPSSRDRHRLHYDCTSKSTSSIGKVPSVDVNNNDINDEVFVN